MPQQNAKQKQVDTAPSFMNQISDATGNMAADNPNTLPLSYGEMGPISRFIFPQAQAVTSPFGTIYYNKNLIEQDHVPISDIVRHEMTHVGQGPMAVIKSMFSNDARNKYELEAQNAEPKPKRRMNDIYLPTPATNKGIDVSPSKKR